MALTFCDPNALSVLPPGEPGLSGGKLYNANWITPSDPSMSSFAGDQLLRGMRCQIRRAD